MRDESAQEHVQVDDALWEELPLDKAGVSRRALSRLLTIALAGLLVVATVVIMTSGNVRLPLSSLGAASSPTALPLPPGWRHAGPGFGVVIAFSPQSPTTLYTCAGVHHHILFGESHDSGGHWQTATLAMPGDDCIIYSNPYDSHELAVEVKSGCTYNCVWQLFRSFDAGQQWQQAFMPEHSVGFADLVWTKNALFAQPDDGEVYSTPSATAVTQVSNLVVISRDHGPFSWVTIPIAPDSSQQSLTFFSIIGAIDTTVYIQYQQLAPTQFVYLQSSDDGLNWHAIALPASFQPDATHPSYFSVNPLAHALVITSDDSAIISYDDGKSWQPPIPLPPILAGYHQPSRILMLGPDGSRCIFYRYHDRDEAQILYGSASDQSQWQQIYRGYAVNPWTLTWGTQGHPVALWGVDSTDHLVRLLLRGTTS